MKYLVYILLFAVVIGCSETPIEEAQNKEVIITGLITNPVEGGTYIRVLGTTETLFRDTVTLDSNGFFSTKFELNEPSFADFLHGSESTTMYISPGDSIHIEIDPTEFDETVKYSGIGALANNFLSGEYLLNEGMSLRFRELYGLPIDSFEYHIDALKLALEKNLNDFNIKNPDIGGNFLKVREGEILYSWANMKIHYEANHKRLAGNDSLVLPDQYYDYFEELNLDDSTLINSSKYRGFISAYIGYRAKQLLEQDTVLASAANSLITAKYNYTIANFSSEALREYQLYQMLRTQIMHFSLKNIKPLVDDFLSITNNADFADKISSDFTEWENLAEGKVAPVFAYPNLAGDTVSLSDFRGKYVYIDVWATWCGPCKAEIPYLHKLEEEYADKNIVFMSVSVDNTEEPWQEMVADKKLGGLQLWAKSWDTDITALYLIKGIPRFMLIDREGNIVDVRAPRPSGKIRDLLNRQEGIDTEEG